MCTEELRDFRAGRFRLIGIEADVVGGGAVVEEDAHRLQPVGIGSSGWSFAAADGGPADRGAVPHGVAGFDVGAAVEQELDGHRASGVSGLVEWSRAAFAASLE